MMCHVSTVNQEMNLGNIQKSVKFDRRYLYKDVAQDIAERCWKFNWWFLPSPVDVSRKAKRQQNRVRSLYIKVNL